MGGCSVIGCKNRVEKGGKHFYRFPKNDKRKFWAIFTKRGPNWIPKDSNTICEVHFAENNFVTKQKRMFLTKESVPTIYFNETAEKLVLTIPYNGNFENYSSFIKHEPTTTETAKPMEVEDSQEVLEKKQDRLRELKTTCRFCMEKKDVLIETKNFLSYNIRYPNLLMMMELSTNYKNYLSDLVCEDCFNQILLLDTFKIKCKSAELKILNELKDLISDLKLSAESVIETTIEDFQNDTENGNLIEPNIQSTFSLNQISEINSSIDPKDIYEDLDEIIKNPKRNKFVLKVFECFFCKKKFGGKRTFNSHACDVKEIKCDECENVYDKEQAYKSHKIRAHDNNQLGKHFCPMCKNVIMGNSSRFLKHRKKCNKERVNPIECEICGKGFETLSGYTIHKLFHESSKSIEEINVLNKKFLGALCDICGKSYKTRRYMKTHMRIKHSNSNESFLCGICTKKFTNRPALNHHKYNSHKVQESPCNICGKVFRNKVLLRKHKIYHDETKRIFKCSQCPDKPGYFTKVALRRHQRCHIIERPFSCNNSCDISFTTDQQLKNHNECSMTDDLNQNEDLDNDVTNFSYQQIEPIVIKLF